MKTSLLVAVSALSLMWGNAAFAQRAIDPSAKGEDLPQISLNTPIQRALAQGSYVTPGEEAVIYADYRLRLEAGQSVRIDLTAEDFDAYLEVYREGKGGAEPLAFNDDGYPDGTDARIRFAADEGGDYVVRVRPFVGTDGGDYELTVTEVAARTYPQGPRLVLGREVSGKLDGNSPLDDDDARYAPYSWTAREGERVALSLASDDFDALLSVGEVSNGRYTELDRNDDDDSAEDATLNSHFVFTAPKAGTYYIMARSVEAEASGSFTLKLEAGPKPPEVRNLSFDQTVDGTLTDKTGRGVSNDRADHWRFRGQAGQRIVAVMTADDFDTYLALLDPSGESIKEDDDGEGELNSRLVHTLPATGDYILEARAVGGGTGSYDLSLKTLAPTPKPSALSFGGTAQGELKSTSAVDDAGQTYAAYVFDGKAGQRIQFTVRSGDFDAVSHIGLVPEDEATPFEALASDDDGLIQGTDSRLNFTLPEDGRYELRAGGLDNDAKGLFSVELVDRGPEPKPGSLIVPSVARGELTDLDSLAEGGGSYDAYVFRAKGDEKLRFTLISSDFDAVVEVGTLRNDTWRASAQDDDSLSDRHARLDWTAPREGQYQVRVRSYLPTARGSYSLIVERQP